MRKTIFVMLLLGLLTGLAGQGMATDRKPAELPRRVEPGELLINEVQASNLSYLDPNGEADDWVEIYNPNDYALDLGGMYMTDSHYSNGINYWTRIPTTAPQITTIPAHGYKVIWFDEQLFQGPLHINDKLGASADAVYLIDADGTTVVNSYTWTLATGLSTADVSIGRLPDGGTVWQLFGAGQTNPCTPGFANAGVINAAPVISFISYSPSPAVPTSPISISAIVTDTDNNLTGVELLWGESSALEHTTAMTVQGTIWTASIGPFATGTNIWYCLKATDSYNVQSVSFIHNILIGYVAPQLFINEVMASNTQTVTDNWGDFEDWVEIYNPNSYAINLAGYYLADEHFTDATFNMQSIGTAAADSTTIPAYGYKVFLFDEEPAEGILHINSKLGAGGDMVYLIAPDRLQVLNSVSWSAATGMLADVSYGRLPNGANTWNLFGAGQVNPATPGASNQPSGLESEPGVSAVPSLVYYPNPMRGNLNVLIPQLKSATEVKVYDLKGALVGKFVCQPGAKSIWDGTDTTGRKLASGIYLLTARAGIHNLAHKVCIIR